MEEDGVFCLGILAGGDSEQGGGLEVERFGLGGQVGGLFALGFGLGGFIGHCGDYVVIERRGAAESVVVGFDALREDDHIVRATGWDFDFDGFACHSVGDAEVCSREVENCVF